VILSTASSRTSRCSAPSSRSSATGAGRAHHARAAREAIQGAIFEGTVAPADLPALRRDRAVTQALLVEGKTASASTPDRDAPPGFEPVQPSLEDAYLVLMRPQAQAVPA
jgi:hypothetical protein